MPSPATARRRIRRWRQGTAVQQAHDDLVVEEPLEIQIDTKPVVVTMRTPGHDEELAIGFLLSEGLIKDRSDVLKLRPHPRSKTGNVLQVFLAPSVQIDFARLTRNVYAASSCGLCGKASIQAVRQNFPKISSRLRVASSALLRAASNLQSAQATFAATGGLHAAAICNLDGDFIVVREDVGRHNAVDKVLGHGALQGLLPFDRHFLVVSGRASFEILQKALAARIALVAAVSAPSSLAAEFAQDCGQTLVGFLRENRMNLYTHPSRVLHERIARPGRSVGQPG
jgi:FdhD protein